MKECPKCKELIGDNVNTCFNCYYNFYQKRIINPNEIKQSRLQQEEKINNMVGIKEDIEKSKKIQLSKNPLYEYTLECVADNSDGTIDASKVQQIINSYSDQGWRLHTIFTNEVGKSASGGAVGWLGMSVNATIDQTVLIFERCIKA